MGTPSSVTAVVCVGKGTGAHHAGASIHAASDATSPDAAQRSRAPRAGSRSESTFLFIFRRAPPRPQASRRREGYNGTGECAQALRADLDRRRSPGTDGVNALVVAYV